jgi:hypothetical protein
MGGMQPPLAPNGLPPARGALEPLPRIPPIASSRPLALVGLYAQGCVALQRRHHKVIQAFETPSITLLCKWQQPLAEQVMQCLRGASAPLRHC